MKTPPGKLDAAKPADTQFPCICATIRKAGRLLTSKYDSFLKPSGLKVTQYSMLANIARNQGIAVTELADLLLMDQTTVTRNLKVLEKAGYIAQTPSARDQRIRQVTLTAEGRDKLDQTRIYWVRAQRQMELDMGAEGVKSLLGSLAKIIG